MDGSSKSAGGEDRFQAVWQKKSQRSFRSGDLDQHEALSFMYWKSTEWRLETSRLWKEGSRRRKRVNCATSAGEWNRMGMPARTRDNINVGGASRKERRVAFGREKKNEERNDVGEGTIA
jgi:hypothetical protein